MCKIAAFFEGGISFDRLEKMTVSELLDVVDNANTIAKERQAQMKAAR